MELDALFIAGILNFLAAVLHVAVIIGGAPWYRFFGAGEELAQLAESGSTKPTILTAFIAAMLLVWGLIAWSVIGLFPELPFVKIALIGITSIYLLRGLAGLIAPFISNHPQIAQNSKRFWLISSLVCIVFGAFHLQGLVIHWASL